MKYFLFFLVLFPILANSELRIDITQGNMDPIPVAILEFNSRDIESKEISSNINNVISNNLQRSGLFLVLPKKLFFNVSIPFESKPTFSDWKITTAQGLVHGKLKLKNEKIDIEFRLWDVLSQKQMVAQKLTTEKSNWRRIAHVVLADRIEKRDPGNCPQSGDRIEYMWDFIGCSGNRCT